MSSFVTCIYKKKTYKTLLLLLMKTNLLLILLMAVGVCRTLSCAKMIFSWLATLTNVCSKAKMTHCTAFTNSRRTKLLISPLTVLTNAITTDKSIVLAWSDLSITEFMNVPSAYTAAALTCIFINIYINLIYKI